MDSGVAFVGYEEGPLLFRPTYRYDVGTDTYDTSEKMRVPAWAGRYSKTAKMFMTLIFLPLDRILYRGSQLDLSAYSRAELKGSDHRPVFAVCHTHAHPTAPITTSSCRSSAPKFALSIQ